MRPPAGGTSQASPSNERSARERTATRGTARAGKSLESRDLEASSSVPARLGRLGGGEEPKVIGGPARPGVTVPSKEVDPIAAGRQRGAAEGELEGPQRGRPKASTRPDLVAGLVQDLGLEFRAIPFRGARRREDQQKLFRAIRELDRRGRGAEASRALRQQLHGLDDGGRAGKRGAPAEAAGPTDAHPDRRRRHQPEEAWPTPDLPRSGGRR